MTVFKKKKTEEDMEKGLRQTGNFGGIEGAAAKHRSGAGKKLDDDSDEEEHDDPGASGKKDDALSFGGV